MYNHDLLAMDMIGKDVRQYENMLIAYEDRGIHLEKIFTKICPPDIRVIHAFVC